MKKYDPAAVRAALVERFDAAGWKEVTVKMKRSGHTLRLVPCAETGRVSCEKDCVFVLVYDTPIPYISDTLDEVARKLANYDEMLADHARAVSQMRAMEQTLRNGCNEYGDMFSQEEWWERYDYFSDWSKDLLGYRVRIPCPEGLA